MNTSLYPLTFEPLLKSVLWGGSDIRPFKGLEPTDETIGESWEISHVPGNFSVIANGSLAGKSLDDLMQSVGEQLVGKSVYERFGHRFPLLIKFIDARDNLSIQVHPDDVLAQARHNSMGKTEMWYVIDAKPGAKLYSGFAKQSGPDDYKQRIANDSFTDLLAEYEVKPGDVFFLPAGRVHAIGAGCFIAEIQQTSDLTYRIYDYNRKDAQGNTRELHTAQAADAIDYTVYPDYRTAYTPEKDKPVPLVDCPYFTTNLLSLDKSVARNHSELDSFVIYICMDGAVEVAMEGAEPIVIHQGQTVLLPASCAHVALTPQGSCKLLETYIVLD